MEESKGQWKYRVQASASYPASTNETMIVSPADQQAFGEENQPQSREQSQRHPNAFKDPSGKKGRGVVYHRSKQ